MALFADNRAQSIQIGAVLMFGILIIMLAVWQAFVVPDQNQEIEFNHNQQLQEQMTELRSTVISMPGATTQRSVPVDLGVRYPSRAIFVNPGPASGTLRTSGSHSPLVIKNATAAGETGDFWDGTARNYPTASIEYRPGYNLYNNAPTTVYEHSVLYNDFETEGTQLSITDQGLIDGDKITLVALNGTLREDRTETVSVDVRPVSTQTRTVEINSAEAGGNITLELPTRLDADRWEELLAEEDHVINVTSGGDEMVVVELADRDDGYQLQMAKVGFGSGVTETDGTYITTVDPADTDDITLTEGESQTFTLEVRDEFNNPKRGVEVNSEADGELEPGEGKTDRDGQVSFEYTAEEGINEDTVRFEIFDGEKSYEEIEFEIDVDEQQNITQPDPAYDVEWNASSFGDEFDCNGGNCEIQVNDSSVTVFDASLSEDSNISGFAEFAVINETVGQFDDGYSLQFTGGSGENTFTAEEVGQTDIVVLAGDDRDELSVEVVRAPSVVTDDATNIGETSATLNGELTNLGTAEEVNVSFEFRETGAGAEWDETDKQPLSGPDSFDGTVSGLQSNTEYEFRAVAEGDGRATGASKTFTTEGDDDDQAPPAVTTEPATDIDSSSATLNGDLTDLGTADEVNVFFEYREDGANDWIETDSQDRTTPGEFSESLSGLDSDTEYEFRAVAEGDGRDEGEIETFTTDTIAPPMFDTLEAEHTGSGAGQRDVIFDWNITGEFDEITFNTSEDSQTVTQRNESVTLDAGTGGDDISAVVEGPGGSETCTYNIGNGESISKEDFDCQIDT